MHEVAYRSAKMKKSVHEKGAKKVFLDIGGKTAINQKQGKVLRRFSCARARLAAIFARTNWFVMVCGGAEWFAVVRSGLHGNAPQFRENARRGLQWSAVARSRTRRGKNGGFCCRFR